MTPARDFGYAESVAERANPPLSRLRSRTPRGCSTCCRKFWTNAPVRLGFRQNSSSRDPPMILRTDGLLDRTVADTPVAILDFETTGLYAGVDRVVEVSVVRVEPGQPRRLALDTLVNPGRRMAATEIHGITEDDVRDAPRFEDIAGT